MTPLVPLDSITNMDISIQENHAGTVTICGITKTAAEWRDMASSFSDGAKWVSVEERLPEGAGQVLAVNSLGYMACVTSLFPTPGGYDGEDATAEETDYPIGDVTHWMPLPEAPK